MFCKVVKMTLNVKQRPKDIGDAGDMGHLLQKGVGVEQCQPKTEVTCAAGDSQRGRAPQTLWIPDDLITSPR